MSLSVLLTSIVFIATITLSFVDVIIPFSAYYWIGIMSPAGIVSGDLILPWAMIFAGTGFIVFIAKREKFRIDFIGGLLLLFFSWTTLTLAGAHYPDNAIDKWTDFAKVVVAALFTMSCLTSRKRIHALIWALCIGLSYLYVKSGMWSLLTGGGLVFGPPGTRFSDNNGMSRIAIMGIPLVYYLYIHSSNKLVRISLFYVFLCGIMTMIGTQSRGAFIAFAAMLSLFIFYSRQKIKIIIALIFIGGIGIFLVPEERISAFTSRMNTINQYKSDQSAQGRFESWVYGIELANSSPLGGGFEAFLAPVHLQEDGTYRARASHSNYFEVLGEHGWIGLLIYLILAAKVIHTTCWLMIATRKNPELFWARDIGYAMQFTFIAYFIGGLTINHSTIEIYYLCIAITSGTAYVAKRELTKNLVADPSHPPHNPSHRFTPPTREPR